MYISHGREPFSYSRLIFKYLSPSGAVKVAPQPWVGFTVAVDAWSKWIFAALSPLGRCCCGRASLVVYTLSFHPLITVLSRLLPTAQVMETSSQCVHIVCFFIYSAVYLLDCQNSTERIFLSFLLLFVLGLKPRTRAC